MVIKKNVVKKYLVDEMSKFRNLDDLRSFVNSLNNSRLNDLCSCLSVWRNNGISDFLRQGPEYWDIEEIDISQIKVGLINETIDPLLERHHFMLESIAHDNDISDHPEFASQSGYNLNKIIAKKQEDVFLIIDGNHRAIRAACDGERIFIVIYY